MAAFEIRKNRTEWKDMKRLFLTAGQMIKTIEGSDENAILEIAFWQQKFKSTP